MHYLIGVLLIPISGSSFGALAIFARLAYKDGVTPISHFIPPHHRRHDDHPGGDHSGKK